MDGLAFFVNQRNPLTALGVDELRQILAGKIVNWSVLGGLELSIASVTVSAGSDIYLEVERMLTGESGISGNARLVPSFEAMLKAVAQEPGAIGYAPLALLDDSVKTLAIDGVLPSPDSVKEQIYPLRSTTYVVGEEEPPPSYRNLIGWIQSEVGQSVVAESRAPLP